MGLYFSSSEYYMSWLGQNNRLANEWLKNFTAHNHDHVVHTEEAASASFPIVFEDLHANAFQTFAGWLLLYCPQESGGILCSQ